jgi:Mrp family chromosome partitioning ATPase
VTPTPTRGVTPARGSVPAEPVAYPAEPAPLVEGEDLPAGGVPALIEVQSIKLPEKVDPQIVMLGDTYSDRADAYRTLRRKLASSGNPRTVAVTSAGAGEGKTTFAVNLALALREGARGRVLLVEANLRAPRLAKLFGFEPPACFAQQLGLHREDPVAPWIVAEALPQLHVLAIDPRAKHPPLLDSVAFTSGMDHLKRAGYEYIVLDTPPVLGSVDCNLIADAVEGMIFTSIQMRSKRAPLRKALEQIQPAPILGVVVLESF